MTKQPSGTAIGIRSSKKYAPRYVVLVLALTAGCTNEVGGPDLGFSPSQITFDHSVGTTACPQNLGAIEARNRSLDFYHVRVAIRDVPNDGRDIDLIDIGGVSDPQPVAVETYSFTVEPNGAASFVPWFNCDEPISFTTDMVVTVNTEEETFEDMLIPVVGNIR